VTKNSVDEAKKAQNGTLKKDGRLCTLRLRGFSLSARVFEKGNQRLIAQHKAGVIGGSATSIDGVITTRRRQCRELDSDDHQPLEIENWLYPWREVRGRFANAAEFFVNSAIKCAKKDGADYWQAINDLKLIRNRLQAAKLKWLKSELSEESR
jgi:hypothetical protein